ncbi:MAG: tRNA uridine-5-carboxymethylaminomethyl(34) synthesis GTPase MnmE, partial [Kiloniellales bacterium]
MSSPDHDTIFALSSGAGRAGVAVIRVSGPGAGPALRALSGRDRAPPARRVTRVRLRDPATGETLDDAVTLWRQGPGSFTGEDVAELHVHGGPAVIAAVLDALAAQPGLRLAEPGEFTRRRFESGKLDLTQAEAIADLVAAETEAQRRLALRQMDGELGRLYDRWREALIKILAELEAEIDFSDQDLPEDVAGRAQPALRELLAEVEAHLADGHRGERIRDGIYVAIVGPPNAGKSSLLNRLARREAAIVAATAGTTRDVIEVRLDLGGYPVVLADTAGLREAGDGIEGEGVRRALSRAEQADLKLVVLDAETGAEIDAATSAIIDDGCMMLVNKIDLRPAPATVGEPGRPAFAMSVKTGEGVEGFLSALEQEVAARYSAGSAPALTRVRHRAALGQAAQAIRRSMGADLSELKAEDLRLAARALGRITGRVDVEDILDVIFRDF